MSHLRYPPKTLQSGIPVIYRPLRDRHQVDVISLVSAGDRLLYLPVICSRTICQWALGIPHGNSAKVGCQWGIRTLRRQRGV